MTNLSAFVHLTRKLTPSPDPRTKEDESKRYDSQYRADSAEETARAWEPEISKHGLGEEREDSSEDIAAERLRGQCRGGVAVVNVCEVVEDGEVDGEDANLGTAESKDGNDGRDCRERSPAKPEESDGKQGAFDACEIQPSFWRLGDFPTPLRTPCEFFLVDAQDCAN